MNSYAKGTVLKKNPRNFQRVSERIIYIKFSYWLVHFIACETLCGYLMQSQTFFQQLCAFK